jgi:uncharacterized protein YjbI with pentapeptide repeats
MRKIIGTVILAAALLGSPAASQVDDEFRNGQQLNGLQLIGGDLRGVDLRLADLGGANLTRVKLGAANLSNASLIGANLTDANLNNANLTHTQFFQTNLHGADLTGATHGPATQEGFTLYEARLCNTRLSASTVVNRDCGPAGQALRADNRAYHEWEPGAVLIGQVGTGNQADQTRLTRNRVCHDCDLRDGRFMNAALTGVDMSRSMLTRANFRGATLTRANFMNAELTGTDFH